MSNARVCPECGASFAPTNGRQVFCTVPHKQAFWRLMAAREAGYRNYKEYYAAIAAERAAFVASCKIEVIDLKGA